MGDPINVIPVRSWEKLSVHSRVNYMKIYTVEHNAKVLPFGNVAAKDEGKFISQFNKHWGISEAHTSPETASSSSGPTNSQPGPANATPYSAQQIAHPGEQIQDYEYPPVQSQYSNIPFYTSQNTVPQSGISPYTIPYTATFTAPYEPAGKPPSAPYTAPFTAPYESLGRPPYYTTNALQGYHTSGSPPDSLSQYIDSDLPKYNKQEISDPLSFGQEPKMDESGEITNRKASPSQRHFKEQLNRPSSPERRGMDGDNSSDSSSGKGELDASDPNNSNLHSLKEKRHHKTGTVPINDEIPTVPNLKSVNERQTSSKKGSQGKTGKLRVNDNSSDRTISNNGRPFPPSLPLLVDLVLQNLPFLSSEPPVPEGKVRARWKCQCGMPLFDDFTELEYGAVEELEQELQELDDSSNATNRLKETVFRVFGSLQSLFEQRFRSRHPDLELSLDNIAQLANNLNANVQPAVSDSVCREAFHLLLCVDEGSSRTVLYQEHLDNIHTDRQLFLFLQSKYFARPSARRWFTARSIKSLALTQFQLDSSNTTDVQKHDKRCIAWSHERRVDEGHVCVCLPPQWRTYSEYECSPAPETQPKMLPAIGSTRLTQYLLHPECIKEKQKTILTQLPKRLGCHGHLQVGEDEEEQTGWGIHIEEDWHWATVYFLCATLILLSLVFGVVWSIVKKDLPGGFAVSSYSVTLGSLLLGYILLVMH
ncbi:hypothetical protein P154DRAFT_216672 [Amniculicola lignicola CBS 123094]|uniref:DUF6590 domain-containing protein n=1 Tax=Amniculicola lignicola CBS 123094 TaxID=1392246 RepID=A0A6A5WKN6_9PLEO|nr:hypothetical protein P154DRAFT_216672 [Amniculicola lignicola CBS 123094]